MSHHDTKYDEDGGRSHESIPKTYKEWREHIERDLDAENTVRHY